MKYEFQTFQVTYKTEVAENLPAKSQALPGADFIARDDSIYILENVTSATIAISIVPDDVPEDIESFYVKLTDVTLIGEPMMNSVPGISYIILCLMREWNRNWLTDNQSPPSYFHYFLLNIYINLNIFPLLMGHLPPPWDFLPSRQCNTASYPPQTPLWD